MKNKTNQPTQTSDWRETLKQYWEEEASLTDFELFVSSLLSSQEQRHQRVIDYLTKQLVDKQIELDQISQSINKIKSK